MQHNRPQVQNGPKVVCSSWKWVLPPGDVPHAGKMLGMAMLSQMGGQERTEEEYALLFTKGWISTDACTADQLSRQHCGGCAGLSLDVCSGSKTTSAAAWSMFACPSKTDIQPRPWQVRVDPPQSVVMVHQWSAYGVFRGPSGWGPVRPHLAIVSHPDVFQVA